MSERISWKVEYEIGIAHIDAQHRTLFDLLEKLRLSLPQGLENQVVGDTLRSLVEYTQTHFAEEEELMRQIGYEAYENHRQLHKELLDHVVVVLKRLRANENYTAIDLLVFLKHWIMDHMVEEDAKISEAFRRSVEAATTS